MKTTKKSIELNKVLGQLNGKEMATFNGGDGYDNYGSPYTYDGQYDEAWIFTPIVIVESAMA